MRALIYLTLLILFVTALVTTSCSSGGSDAQPDEFAQQAALLINNGNPWVASPESSVIKDGFDVSDQFNGFNLKFSNGTFTTENALPSAWPSQGNWELDPNNKNIILRSDGVVMQSQVSGNSLILTYTSNKSSSGRMNSVIGDYQFILISQ